MREETESDRLFWYLYDNLKLIFWNNYFTHICALFYTICPGSSDPIYIVTCYVKWVSTSWTHSSIFFSSDFFNSYVYEMYGFQKIDYKFP